MKSHRVVLLLAIASVLLFTTPLFADSNIRSVRLSFVQGSVLIDNGTGQGFEPAVMNMPVTGSTRLQTGDDGLAEVEFENGSTLRLTGDTSVLVQPLLLTTKGQRISGMTVTQGTIYIHIQKVKHDLFFLKVHDLELQLTKNTHLRVSADNTQILVAVFQGELQDAASGLQIKKNQSFRIDIQDGAITEVAKGIDPFATDAWDAEREQYYKNPNAYASLATSSLAFAPTYVSDDCGYGMIPGAFGVWGSSCFYGEPYAWNYWSSGIIPIVLPPKRPFRPPLPHRPGHPREVASLPKTVVKLPAHVPVPTVATARGGATRPGVGNPAGAAAFAQTHSSQAATASKGAHWVPVPQQNNRGSQSYSGGSRGFAPSSNGGGSARSGGYAASSGSSMRSSGGASSSAPASSASSAAVSGGSRK